KVTKRRKPTSSLSLVDEFVDEGIPEREPRFDDEEADMQRAAEESLKSVHDAHRGPLPSVVFREPDSRKFQPLLEVHGKRKEKRRTPAPTEPSGHAESLLIYVELGLTDSHAEFDKVVPLVVKIRAQDEDQAGPNPSATDVSTHQNPEQIDKGFTATAYPNVQKNLKITVKEQAIQAPFWNHFRDLPEADMKEILHQRMWETNSYKAHEDHMMLKNKKRHDSSKTPPGSPPHQPPPPPPPAGQSRTLRSSKAFGLSQLPHPPPPPPSTSQSNQPKSTTTPSSSKTTASAEYTAWTTTDTRLKPSVSLIPKALHMDDDTAPDEQVHPSNDEDIGNAHIPKVNLKQDWWKTLEEDKPATPEPAWSIPSSDLPILKNNWASALVSTYIPPSENLLLVQTGDMVIFMDWFYKQQGITELKPQYLEGPTFDLVKVFHLNVTIQSDFFFNKDLEYLRYGCKGGRPTLSISKIKAAYYPDVGLEQMVLDQMWIEDECKHSSKGDHIAVRTHIRILSVVKIEVFSMYVYDYMKKIVLCRANINELTIAERDFKYSYPNEFEDLTLHQIDEALDYWVKEFKVNRMNL
nr:hypothetical protein [Tanacetum cinerariifolium]